MYRGVYLAPASKRTNARNTVDLCARTHTRSCLRLKLKTAGWDVGTSTRGSAESESSQLHRQRRRHFTVRMCFVPSWFQLSPTLSYAKMVVWDCCYCKEAASHARSKHWCSVRACTTKYCGLRTSVVDAGIELNQGDTIGGTVGRGDVAEVVVEAALSPATENTIFEIYGE